MERRDDRLGRKTDEELMACFQAGEIEAFNLLVERHSIPMRRFVGRHFRNGAICEDLVQETFVRVYRNRHSYRQIAKVSTWMYTILKNLAHSEHRRRKLYRAMPLHQTNPEGEDYEYHIPDTTFCPERKTAGSVVNGHIQRAFGMIPPDFREMVVFRDVQQLTQQEIEEITGLCEGTVKSRMWRGRIALREILRDVYAEQVSD